MTDNTGNHVILTEGVTKRYSDNGVPVEAVRGVDLKIERAEYTAIAGPSGSTTNIGIVSRSARRRSRITSTACREPA